MNGLKRLTHKFWYSEHYLPDHKIDASRFDCYDKLGQLEDLEKELNADINNDLSKVLLASAKGFYHKEQCKNIVTKQKITRYVHEDYAYCYYSKDTNTWWVATINDCFPLYLYGTLWALTREELEDEQEDE